MNALDKRISLQLSQAGATKGKRVVVVEGTGDISFLTLMLDKAPFRQHNVLARYVLVDAGGKDAVFKTLSQNPDYLAIIDRDAWTDTQCEEKKAEHPNLHILPRFCIENYIICPNELRTAFGDIKGLEAVEEAIDMGIRHGCLWRAAQPLYEELMHAGFNKKLLTFPPPDHNEIKRLVTLWQGILSDAHIDERMQKAYDACGKTDKYELLRTFVHGKVFWTGVVERLFEKKFPNAAGERLKVEAFKRIQIPKDLESFLMEVFK